MRFHPFPSGISVSGSLNQLVDRDKTHLTRIIDSTFRNDQLDMYDILYQSLTIAFSKMHL